MKKILSVLAATTVAATVAPTVVSCSSDAISVTIPNIKPVDQRNFTDKSKLPAFSYIPTNTSNSNLNAFANDPCSIIYDGKGTYYSWQLFRNGRNFQSDWVEMTSKDLLTWKQTTDRIQIGREFKQPDTPGSWPPAAMGGSVFVDNAGKYFDKGDVVYIISMQQSVMHNSINKVDEEITGDCGIAYFVSHGLGKPIYTSGVLATFNPYLKLPEGDYHYGWDWRDPFVFQDPTSGDLYLAIANYSKLQMWKVESFGNKGKYQKPQDFKNTFEAWDNGRIKYVSSFTIRDFDNKGTEVPNVVYVGNNKWLVTASVQDSPKKRPYQSAWWFLCTLDKDGKFVQISSEHTNGRLEYGSEGYAERISDPFVWTDKNKAVSSADGIKSLVARSMPANWAYDTDIWAWKGGAYTADKLYVDNVNNTVKQLPADIAEKDYDKSTGTAIYHLKGKNFRNNYELKFSYGTFNLKLATYDGYSSSPFSNPDNEGMDGKQVLGWENDVYTTMPKWTNQGGLTDDTDEIEIVVNQCTLTIYNTTRGWVAHFMLPQGITHIANKGAKSWDIANEYLDAVIDR